MERFHTILFSRGTTHNAHFYFLGAVPPAVLQLQPGKWWWICNDWLIVKVCRVGSSSYCISSLYILSFSSGLVILIVNYSLFVKQAKVLFFYIPVHVEYK